MRRVVVTGIGLVTPLACGAEESWCRLINGKSGLNAITNFDVSDIPSKIAGQIPRSEDPKASTIGAYNPNEWIVPKEQRRMDTFIQYGLVASTYAVEDSGWKPLDDEGLARTGVMIGSGIGGLNEIYKTSVTVHEGNIRKVSPFFIPASLINLI